MGHTKIVYSETLNSKTSFVKIRLFAWGSFLTPRHKMF